jgi:hypothetical protein
MKRENIHTARRIVDQLALIDNNIRNVDRIFENYTSESDGGNVSDKNPMYQLHVSEYADGSGVHVNLSGLKINFDILKFIREKMIQRRNELESELATL